MPFIKYIPKYMPTGYKAASANVGHGVAISGHCAVLGSINIYNKGQFEIRLGQGPL